MKFPWDLISKYAVCCDCGSAVRQKWRLKTTYMYSVVDCNCSSSSSSSVVAGCRAVAYNVMSCTRTHRELERLLLSQSKSDVSGVHRTQNAVRITRLLTTTSSAVHRYVNSLNVDIQQTDNQQRANSAVVMRHNTALSEPGSNVSTTLYTRRQHTHHHRIFTRLHNDLRVMSSQCLTTVSRHVQSCSYNAVWGGIWRVKRAILKRDGMNACKPSNVQTIGKFHLFEVCELPKHSVVWKTCR